MDSSDSNSAPDPPGTTPAPEHPCEPHHHLTWTRLLCGCKAAAIFRGGRISRPAGIFAKKREQVVGPGAGGEWWQARLPSFPPGVSRVFREQAGFRSGPLCANVFLWGLVH
jgi:hypothetical protein